MIKLRLTHTQTKPGSLFISDIAKDTRVTNKQAAYIPFYKTTVVNGAKVVDTATPGSIELVISDDVRLSSEEGVIKGLVDQGLLTSVTFESNTAPTADDQILFTPFNTPLDILLSGFDAEDDDLTFVLEQLPNNGALTGTAPNLVYTPEDGFDGADTFTFRAFDGANFSEPATIAITVEPEV